MLKKTFVSSALALAFLVAGVYTLTAHAADTEKTPKIEKAMNAYRLDFSVNELESGKKISARQYSMNLNSDSSNELKIGTRVPVESKPGEFQYLDVGTSIWSRVEDRNGTLDLSVRAEISNFATQEPAAGHETRPVLRQLKISGGTLALLGKPVVLGSVDDPNSKRQFQLEVIATKLQ